MRVSNYNVSLHHESSSLINNWIIVSQIYDDGFIFTTEICKSSKCKYLTKIGTKTCSKCMFWSSLMLIRHLINIKKKLRKNYEPL